MSNSYGAEPVVVTRQSVTTLLNKAQHPLAIDRYQRPYVWGVDKVEQLIADLEEYLVTSITKAGQTPPDYYMGTVLLHKAASHDSGEDCLFIIDGQQRLTTLSVLYHCITHELPTQCNPVYFSPESERNIRLAQQCFAHSKLKDIATTMLFSRISLTVITVESEDLAFTFFDTQNSRGVPLEACHLLKAYHLRAITGEESARTALLERCAQRWEQQGNTQHLFERFLWRARLWKGQNSKALKYESHDALLAEFEKNTLEPLSDAASVPLYGHQGNRLASQLSLQGEASFNLSLAPISLAPDSADLPFVLRQPINRGVGFFLYAEKYAALVNRLFKDDPSDAQLCAFQDFYNDVVKDLSIYLRELYQLACVVYLDKFGSQQLLSFALWLDHVLGAIRIDHYSIYKQTPMVFLRDEEHNLLDIIAQAFRSEEVIRYLENYPGLAAAYAKETNEGVRGRYKQRLLCYYGQTEGSSLKDKQAWIRARLTPTKPTQGVTA